MANFKDGVIRNGSSPGSGTTIGKVRNYSIKGGEKMDETSAVAVYHFLVKNIF